jgi:hypothetical protein
MCQSIVHRGPDDEGVLANQNAGLETRRLIIIDSRLNKDAERKIQENKICSSSCAHEKRIERRDSVAASGFATLRRAYFDPSGIHQLLDDPFSGRRHRVGHNLQVVDLRTFTPEFSKEFSGTDSYVPAEQ